MLKRNSKKGFTLAELLIVVAIIAILVAIAVPLFVGALNTAEEKVKDANIRAVRGAAVEEILMNYEKYELKGAITGTEGGTGDKAADLGWKATAKVSANGEVSELKIVNVGLQNTDTAMGDSVCADDKGGKYLVTVYIKELKAE